MIATFDDLLGVPYLHLGRDPREGLDCLGLVLEVQRRMGFTVADPVPTYGVDPGRAFADNWAASWKHVDSPEVGDAVLMQTPGRKWPNHVGVIVEPGRVMHTLAGVGVAVEPLARLIHARRVVGFFRPRETNRGLSGDFPGTEVHAESPALLTVVLVDGQESRPFIAEPGGEVFSYLPAGVERAGLVAFANGVRVDSGPVGPGHLTFFRPVADPVTGTATVTFLGTAVFTTSAAIAAAAALVGNLIIGGLLAYLGSMISAPKEQTLDGGDPARPTFDLGGARNTVANGATVPVVYGEHKVGGQVISLFQRTGSDLKSRLYMLLALSEGEVQSIGGLTADTNQYPADLITGSNIELNGNPISNYPDCKVSVRMGTVSQDPIPGFEETVVSGDVSQTVDNALDVRNYTGIVAENADTVTYTTSAAIDAFEINLRFPAGRYSLGTTGDTMPLGFTGTLRYRRVGVPASEVAEFLNLGALQLRADHTITIRRQGLTKDLYEISLTKTYPDNANENRIFGDFQWTTTNEIDSDLALAYPCRALLAIEAVATNQLSGGVPTVTSIVKGKKVNVWDGVSTTSPAFTFAWSDSPAWVAMDVLLQPRYGLGAFVGLRDIDLQSFKDWADYCDDSITTDGVSHTRWQYDSVLDVQQPSWSAIQEIAASGRASVVYAGSKFKVKIDTTTSASQLFCMGNVVRGSYQCSYLNPSTRPNFIEVQYVNRDLGYDQDVAQLESASAITDDARKETVRMYGITRAQQAYRAAKYLLNVSTTLTKTLKFSAPIDAVAVEPGDVFYFSHDVPQISVSGRLYAAGGSSVALDRAVTVVAGWKIYVRTANGPLGEDFYEYTPANGVYAAGATINCTGITFSPEIGDLYVAGPSTTYRTTWRVVRKTFTACEDSFISHIEAVQYDADVYTDDPGEIESFTDAWPDSRKIPTNPTNVLARNVAPIAKDGTVAEKIEVSFVPEADGDIHDVWVRYEDQENDILPGARIGGWTHAGSTRTGALSVNVVSAYAHTATVSVTPRSENGGTADPERGAKAVCFIIGRTDEPDAPNIVSVQTVDDKLLIQYEAPTDADIACVEFRQSSATNRWLFAQQISCSPCCSPAVDYPDYYGSTALVAKSTNTSGVPSLTPDSLAMVPALLAGSFTCNTSVTGAGFTAAGTSDTNFTLTGSNLRSDAAATSATWQTANTTFSLSALHVRVHAFLDARGLDLVSTVADWGMPLSDPYYSRYVMTGELLDIPHPEKAYRLDQMGWQMDSPYAKQWTLGEAYDWASNYSIVLEYSLATDSGGTTWGSWYVYDGPFECVSKYYVRFRVTFTSTAGEYSCELAGLYVQAKDLTASSGSVVDSIAEALIYG